MNSTLCDSRDSSSLNPASNPNSGLVKLLACFGLSQERQIPDKNILSLNGAEEKYSEIRKLKAAATKLLRESIEKEPPLTATEYTQVQHTRQLETWDCGIACLQIALRWLRGTECDGDSELTEAELMERRLMLEEAATRSIWTVDLVMLLEKQLKQQQKDNHHQEQPNHDNTTYLFCSEVMGANASHSTTGYYANAFESDSARVSKIFEEMHTQQLPMLCPFNLHFSELVYITSYAHCIAIILVDNSVLMYPLRNNVVNCQQQQSTTTQPEDDLSEHKENDTYAGHYVILCGKSTDPGHIQKARAWERKTEVNTSEAHEYCLVLANPGIPDQIMFVTPRLLEASWSAEGTDRDLIFIAKHT